jgi:hypothetical protein
MKHRGIARLTHVFALGVLLMATGCAAVHSPAMGMFWMDVEGPIEPGATVGLKTGKACAKSYLGFVALGDASIATAAKAGGITNIQTVDHHTTHKVFVGEFCTVVHGS